MDCVFLEFMCFPAFGDDYIQRFPGGNSCTVSSDPHQLGMGDVVNVSDRFSLVGTLSTFSNVFLVPLVEATRHARQHVEFFTDPSQTDMPLAALLSQCM